MKKGFLLLLFLLSGLPLLAGTFEGKILYKITSSRGEQQIAMYYLGSKARTEVSAEGHRDAIIMDFKAKTIAILMPERKAYMLRSMTRSVAASQGAKGTLRKTGASDSVAGYNVSEWVYESDKGKTSLWLTEQLGGGIYSQSMASRDLVIPEELKNKGVTALRIVTYNGFRMEATKVQRGAPNASLFEIPSDYSQMSSAQSSADAGAGTASPSDSPSQLQNSMNSMPPDAAARVKAALDNMSPDQKAAYEKAMQGQGNQ
jgi:hypothetical protein